MRHVPDVWGFQGWGGVLFRRRRQALCGHRDVPSFLGKRRSRVTILGGSTSQTVQTSGLFGIPVGHQKVQTSGVFGIPVGRQTAQTSSHTRDTRVSTHAQTSSRTRGTRDQTVRCTRPDVVTHTWYTRIDTRPDVVTHTWYTRPDGQMHATRRRHTHVVHAIRRSPDVTGRPQVKRQLKVRHTSRPEAQRRSAR